MEESSVMMSKRLAKNALLATGALRWAGSVSRPGIVILLYHSVFEGADSHANTLDMGHPAELFRQQMEIIARRYDPVNLNDVPLFLSGEKRMPRRPVAVTFDDGYANNFEVATPILDHYGIPAVFYVTTGCIDRNQLPWIARVRRAFRTTGRPVWNAPYGRVFSLATRELRETARLAACEYCAQLAGAPQERAIEGIELALDIDRQNTKDVPMLSWDQLRRMVHNGHIVGSHTVSHPNLAHVARADLMNELVESKRKLEQELGVATVHFAYPNPILTPHWTSGTIYALRQAGYQTAVIATPGIVRQTGDPLCMPRVASSRKLDAFRWNLECVFLGRRTMS